MKDKNFLTKQTFIIASIFALSSVLGLLRESVITYMFGATDKTDAYFVALTIPSLFVGLISGSITSTFVSIYSSYLAKNEKKQAEKTANCILSIFFFILLILYIILFIFSRESIRLVAHNYVGQKLNISIQILRILLTNVIFGGLLGILTGINNSNNSFLAPASIGLVLNIVMITGSLFLGKFLGIYALAISNSIAVMLQFLIQIPSAKKYGLKYKFIIDLNDPGLREMIRLVLPFIVSALVGQVNLIIDRSFATSFPEGVVTSLYLSGKLVLLPQTIFGSALSMVILPSLVRYATQGEWKNTIQTLKKGLNLASLILLPFVVLFLTLSTPIVIVLFEHGKFNASDTILTANIIPFLLGVMYFGTIFSVLNNIYYAIKDIKYIVFTSVVSVISKILLSYLLIASMKQWGLVLADSVASFIAVVVMLVGLKFRLKLKESIDKNAIIKYNIKIIISSLIMATAIIIIRTCFFNNNITKLGYNFVEIVVCSTIGIVIYFIVCLIFKIEEAEALVSKVKSIGDKI